ncbi:MAG: hypothetical protein NTY94_01890 [Alphaproteobacteria bacterium]|nr:hypothetical protein [Alphaproteobacteria bacterium]
MTWAWHNPVPVAHDHPPHPGLDLIARLESVFRPLFLAIASFANLLPTQPHLAILTPAPLLMARLLLARTRLARAHARIAALLHRLAEGTWQPPRPHTPRASRKRAPSPYLPRRKGWLGHVTDHHVRAHASQFTHLLNDPGTQSILSHAPAQARATFARILRGPTRLLALDLPNPLQFQGPPRPPRIRKHRLPSPRTCGGSTEGGVASNATPPGLLPTDHPIPKNALAFARYNRRRFGKGA